MRLFLFSFFICFSALASDWIDLLEGKTYTLSQSFQLPQLERSRSILDFTKGDRLRLKEIIPLTAPGVSLALYIFDYSDCPGMDLLTDMEIVQVDGTAPAVLVGTKVEECEINMYIESKDQYSKSLFE